MRDARFLSHISRGVGFESVGKLIGGAAEVGVGMHEQSAGGVSRSCHGGQRPVARSKLRCNRLGINGARKTVDSHRRTQRKGGGHKPPGLIMSEILFHFLDLLLMGKFTKSEAN